MIRPFSWRDLPALHRYRQRGLFLDSAQALTRGQSLVPTGALLASMVSTTGLYTYVGAEKGSGVGPLFAQAMHTAGASLARLTFLAPESAMETGNWPALLDHLCKEIGKVGAFHLLAEVDECISAFQALHEASFAIYARQRIWKIKGSAKDAGSLPYWRPSVPRDQIGVRTLYNNLVPGLVQQVEPLPKEHAKGLVCYRNGDLLAYVDLRFGPVGIWAQPFIHPDAVDLAGDVVSLLLGLPNRRGRPVYLCVRSYQCWLEPAIEEAGAAAGDSQAVMVRHLARLVRSLEPYAVPAMNGTRAEPIAHMVDGRNLTTASHPPADRGAKQ